MNRNPPFPPRRQKPARHHRRWLALLLLCFALLALVYSLTLPLGEAADEFAHFALIRFLTEHRRPPLSVAEQYSISVKGDASPVYHTLVALLTQHVDVSPLPGLPDPRQNVRRAIPADRLPFKGLYHTEDEYFPFRGIVLAWHLARLVSIPLGLITLLSIYGLVRRLFPHRPALALAAVSFAAFNPRFLITSAIISDDNLVLPLIALTLYSLTRILQGDFRRRTFIWLGILAGLAAVTKYHALTLLPVIGLGLGWLVWRTPTARGPLLRQTGLALLAFALIAVSWFGFVLVQFNQVAQMGWVRGLLAAFGDPVIAGGAGRALADQTGPGLGYEAPLGWGEWFSLLFRTFWFRLGRGHTIQSPLTNLALALLAVLAAAGWLTRPPRLRQVKQHLTNPRAVLLGLLLLHLLLYAGLVTTRYLSLPTRETAQGRHLFPALPTLALLTALGLSRLLYRLPHPDTLTASALATGLGLFA
ncbi:MAG: phospholipid carrier-dependent glycosyltransferase, partial [Chloroflexi bacterium]